MFADIGFLLSKSEVLNLIVLITPKGPYEDKDLSKIFNKSLWAFPTSTTAPKIALGQINYCTIV